MARAEPACQSCTSARHVLMRHAFSSYVGEPHAHGGSVEIGDVVQPPPLWV